MESRQENYKMQKTKDGEEEAKWHRDKIPKYRKASYRKQSKNNENQIGESKFRK